MGRKSYAVMLRARMLEKAWVHSWGRGKLFGKLEERLLSMKESKHTPLFTANPPSSSQKFLITKSKSLPDLARRLVFANRVESWMRRIELHSQLKTSYSTVL